MRVADSPFQRMLDTLQVCRAIMPPSDLCADKKFERNMASIRRRHGHSEDLALVLFCYTDVGYHSRGYAVDKSHSRRFGARRRQRLVFRVVLKVHDTCCTSYSGSRRACAETVLHVFLDYLWILAPACTRGRDVTHTTRYTSLLQFDFA